MLDMMLDALRLMSIGIGVVFALLLLFVGVILAMSSLVRRFAGPSSSSLPEQTLGDRGSDTDTALIAVMAAAIARYRARGVHK